jgi:hypothetical protein
LDAVWRVFFHSNDFLALDIEGAEEARELFVGAVDIFTNYDKTITMRFMFNRVFERDNEKFKLPEIVNLTFVRTLPRCCSLSRFVDALVPVIANWTRSYVYSRPSHMRALARCCAAYVGSEAIESEDFDGALRAFAGTIFDALSAEEVGWGYSVSRLLSVIAAISHDYGVYVMTQLQTLFQQWMTLNSVRRDFLLDILEEVVRGLPDGQSECGDLCCAAVIELATAATGLTHDQYLQIGAMAISRFLQSFRDRGCLDGCIAYVKEIVPRSFDALWMPKRTLLDICPDDVRTDDDISGRVCHGLCLLAESLTINPTDVGWILDLASKHILRNVTLLALPGTSRAVTEFLRVLQKIGEITCGDLNPESLYFSVLRDGWEVMKSHDCVMKGYSDKMEWKRRTCIKTMTDIASYAGEAAKNQILDWVKTDETGGNLSGVIKLGALESVAADCEGHDLSFVVGEIISELGKLDRNWTARRVVKGVGYCIQALLNSEALWSDSVDASILTGLQQICNTIEGVITQCSQIPCIILSKSFLAVTGNAMEGVRGLVAHHVSG